MYEDDTGLIYMRARYYSPELRRFINADKVHGDITNALTLNRYAFVNGNPAVNVDPEGLKGVDARGGSNGDGTYWTTQKQQKAYMPLPRRYVYESANIKPNSKKEDFWSWLKRFATAVGKSIEFEVGGGYGLGISAKAGPVEVQVEAYSDTLTYIIDDDYGFMANSGSIGISVGMLDNDKASFGVSGSFYHEYIQQYKPCHTTLSNPFEAASCECAETTPISTDIPIYGSLNSNCSNEDLVIGFSASAHLGLGGHISIGINIDEIIEEMGW